MNNKMAIFIFDGAKLDEYARGFISGIMYFICGKPDTTWEWCRFEDDDGNTLWEKHLDCTLDQGTAIYDEIEKHYPGVIVALV